MQKKIYGLSLIFVIIDQIIKVVVSNNIMLNKDISVIPNFFYITNVHNDGAAFSMFSGNRFFLIIVTIIALLAAYLCFIRNKKLKCTELVCISMLLGGIVGNFIDRIIFGYVIDYLGVILGSYYFPIFNFADICIVLSVFGLILLSIKEDICKSSKLKKKLEE